MRTGPQAAGTQASRLAGASRDATGSPGGDVGQYRILRRLATGGMAEVYLGKLVGAGGFEKKVAIKRMLPALAADPAAAEAFLQEARLCVHLVHPHVVQVLDLGTTGGAPYLVMELVDGEDLRHVLNAASAAGEPLDPAEAIHVAACVAEAPTRRPVPPERRSTSCIAT